MSHFDGLSIVLVLTKFSTLKEHPGNEEYEDTFVATQETSTDKSQEKSVSML